MFVDPGDARTAQCCVRDLLSTDSPANSHIVA